MVYSTYTLTISIYGFLFYFPIIWSLGTSKPVFAKLAKLGKIFYWGLKGIGSFSLGVFRKSIFEVLI